MKVALIAPPFIAIPPKNYGGTELFISELALGLKEMGAEVVLYTNGESEIDVEKRWLFEKGEWPIKADIYNHTTDSIHTAWALREASQSADIIHVNSATGTTYSEFIRQPMVCTLHHPLEPALTGLYRHFDDVHYVCISAQQAQAQGIPSATVIHHGIDLSQYRLCETKKNYMSFLGRIAPIKGPHLAIEVARKSGIPLKIAGEVQPMYKDYFESEIRPQVDGKLVEFIGEVNLEEKNELLGNSLAMLFPIQWDEPFGLVMIEAMACGTPVLAFSGGSVPEIVRDGISGFVCRDTTEMAERALQIAEAKVIQPAGVRQYTEAEFSTQKMAVAYHSLYQKILSGRSMLQEPRKRTETTAA